MTGFLQELLLVVFKTLFNIVIISSLLQVSFKYEYSILVKSRDKIAEITNKHQNKVSKCNNSAGKAL